MLLVLFLFLSTLVDDLFVSDCSHFLGVAVLNVKSKLTLEQHVASKVFGELALVLLVEVDKGLLRSWNDLDLGYIPLAGSAEIDLELFFCSARWEVLDEE